MRVTGFHDLLATSQRAFNFISARKSIRTNRRFNAPSVGANGVQRSL
jgi:hypothetical protein